MGLCHRVTAHGAFCQGRKLHVWRRLEILNCYRNAWFNVLPKKIAVMLQSPATWTVFAVYDLLLWKAQYTCCYPDKLTRALLWCWNKGYISRMQEDGRTKVTRFWRLCSSDICPRAKASNCNTLCRAPAHCPDWGLEHKVTKPPPTNTSISTTT